MRKIPATMATQHPDNACPAYFTGKRFVSAQDEIEECFRCFSELGLQEYMWDWEGKFVDESVIDRLFTKYHEFFSKQQIGKDVFLTFRIPNIWIESSHKLPRSFMNIISAENAAQSFKLHSPPLFEVILPMATTADQLIYLQRAFTKISRATEDIFETKTSLKTIDVIPLFEKFEVVMEAEEILEKYLNFLNEEYNYEPEYLRIFTARSDPAMNAGFIPAKVMSKLAISSYHQFGKKRGIKVFPWIGGGCLPFRGGINPENIPAVVEEYRGVATVTLQSAFRYDYALDEVKKAVAKLNAQIPKNLNKYIPVNEEQKQMLSVFHGKVEKFFRAFVEANADMINAISRKLPSHRERVQHIGLFGYSRGVGKVKLPRAINFTGSLYSIGVPPELIGSGRALRLAKEMGMLDFLEELCPFLREDFLHAGHYLNRENLDFLCKQNKEWVAVKKEILEIEKILKIEIGPEQPHHIMHRNFTSNIYQKLIIGEDFAEDALKAAEIRKSLG